MESKTFAELLKDERPFLVVRGLVVNLRDGEKGKPSTVALYVGGKMGVVELQAWAAKQGGTPPAVTSLYKVGEKQSFATGGVTFDEDWGWRGSVFAQVGI